MMKDFEELFSKEEIDIIFTSLEKRYSDNFNKRIIKHYAIYILLLIIAAIFLSPMRLLVFSFLLLLAFSVVSLVVRKDEKKKVLEIMIEMSEMRERNPDYTIEYIISYYNNEK